MASPTRGFAKVIGPSKPLGYGFIYPLESIRIKFLRFGQRAQNGDGREDGPDGARKHASGDPPPISSASNVRAPPSYMSDRPDP